MSFKKLQWIFGLSLVAIATLIVALYFFLRSAVQAQLPDRICLPMYSADVVCYSQSEPLAAIVPTAIAISPDGNLLAANDGSKIQLWDLATRQPLQPLIGHNGTITALAISPDGRTLASSSLDRTTNLWDLQRHTLIGSMASGRASTLAFSPDGRRLATGSRVRQWADGVYSSPGVQFWDVATQQFLFKLGEEPTRAIAFSPDGNLFAVGNTKTEVWSLQDGEFLYRLNSGELTGVAFTQDSQMLMTTSSKIKFWNLANGEETQSFNSGASDSSISPDGQTLAAVVGGTVHLWQLPTEQYLGFLRGSWYSGLFVRFALQGQAIVVGNSEGIRIWQGNFTISENAESSSYNQKIEK